jgi:hypothetical protein
VGDLAVANNVVLLRYVYQFEVKCETLFFSWPKSANALAANVVGKRDPKIRSANACVNLDVDFGREDLKASKYFF